MCQEKHEIPLFKDVEKSKVTNAPNMKLFIFSESVFALTSHEKKPCQENIKNIN